MKSWETIKKLLVDDGRGGLDTIDWVYRKECKEIDKALEIKKEDEIKIHKNQLTIDDLY